MTQQYRHKQNGKLYTLERNHEVLRIKELGKWEDAVTYIDHIGTRYTRPRREFLEKFEIDFVSDEKKLMDIGKMTVKLHRYIKDLSLEETDSLFEEQMNAIEDYLK